MTKVNSVLVLPLGREGASCQPPPGVKERVYEAVIEEKTKDYIFLRICKDCCEELGLQPDREIQVCVFNMKNDHCVKSWDLFYSEIETAATEIFKDCFSSSW